MATFEVELDPLGHGRVIVNGEDVSREVMALQIDAAVREPTILRLQMKPGYTGKMSGEGIVQVGIPVDLDGLLAGMDPEELESEAAARLGWGDGSNLTAKIIEVLRERINGAQS